MRDKPVFPSLVFRLTPLNIPSLGAGMFISAISLMVFPSVSLQGICAGVIFIGKLIKAINVPEKYDVKSMGQ